MRFRLTGMTAALAVGVTAAVALACAAGAWLYSIHHFETLLDGARRASLAQGELIRAVLEHQMMENDRTLIDRMIRTFGREPEIERILLLDRLGRVRFASTPGDAGVDLRLGSPTCQACHRLPPEQRTASRVIETGEGTLLRTVVPVRNQEPCHRCHDPVQRINGILIVDRNAGLIRAEMNRDLRWMVSGTGLLALLLVAAIGGVVGVVVMRRLQRFETTARLIAGGDLERRVPVEGTDTVAWLGREFNSMADGLARLVREVGAQRAQLEAVINGIDDGIVVLDLERRIIAANDAFLRRAGRGRTELLGTLCRDSVAGSCGTGTGTGDCPTQACLLTGEVQVRLCERRTAGGETVWEEVHASPIRRETGAIVQVVEVWRDISERRAAEARLAESHRLASLGMLASGFSHEMNTPLATVLTCVEGIQRELRGAPAADAPDWQRVGESAAIAREQLLRCRGITQHFLKLSRGPGGGPPELVDLEPAFAAVARLIEPTARAHGVSVAVEPLSPGLRVRAGDAALQHVLLNLLLNAIEACGSGGKVTLGADGGGAQVRIRVSDDGCGIAPESLKRIFEPFYSGRQGGTGLGLFLSLDFVRRWGGEIEVRSAPGVGSTFEVVLPPAPRAPALGVMN